MSGAAQRLFDLSGANCLEPSGDTSEEHLDIPPFHDTSYNHNAQLGSLDLSGAASSQQEFFTYEPDGIGPTLDAINDDSLDFHLESHAALLQYMNTRPDSAFGNVLDEIPRENLEYRDSTSYSSHRLFSPDFMTGNLKFQKLSDNSLRYSNYQDIQPLPGLERLSERTKNETDADQCHLNEYFDGVNPYDSYTVHCQVVDTITRELEYESKFQSGELNLENRPPRKKRRKPNEVDWRPESVFRSYVDCKPADIHKTSYPDHVPMCSCFGRINMREAKAWSRQPNKPKRQRIKAEAKNRGYTRRRGESYEQPPEVKEENTDFFVVCSIFP